MTRRGEKIPNVTAAEIKERLAATADGKAVKRLIVAREYLDGQSPAAIEEKYGIPEQTSYEWLDRFEERGLEAALADDKPPGRDAVLSEDERARFERAVQRPPPDAGFDAAVWTSALAREYLRGEFGVDYSPRHVRRLLTEARATSRTSRT